MSSRSLIKLIGNSWQQISSKWRDRRSSKLRSWYLVASSHLLPSAGYQCDTPLAVNRWHGSPVGLSSTCWVLDRAAPFARRSCWRSDGLSVLHVFFVRRILSLARVRLQETSLPFLRLVLVDRGPHPVSERGTGRKGPLKVGPLPSIWRNATRRTGRTKKREGRRRS